MENTSPAPTIRTTYAGFWLRGCAVLVDLVVVSLPFFVLGFSIRRANPRNMDELLTNLQILQIVVSWLYWAILESSTRQATIGKRLFSLRVTDAHGQQISFARATGRHFGKVISGMILGMGYVMAAFTDKKQTLHDTMAGCLVLRTQSPIPPPPEIHVPSPPDPPYLSGPPDPNQSSGLGLR